MGSFDRVSRGWEQEGARPSGSGRGRLPPARLPRRRLAGAKLGMVIAVHEISSSGRRPVQRTAGPVWQGTRWKRYSQGTGQTVQRCGPERDLPDWLERFRLAVQANLGWDSLFSRQPVLKFALFCAWRALRSTIGATISRSVSASRGEPCWAAQSSQAFMGGMAETAALHPNPRARCSPSTSSRDGADAELTRQYERCTVIRF